MSINLQAARLFIVAVASTIGLFCMSTAAVGGLAAAPAKGIDLSGEWRLNPALSDDPQKVLEEIRSKMRERMPRHRRRPNTDGALDISDVVGPRRDEREDFAELLEMPQLITLTQSDRGLAIKNGKTEVRYEAGGKSVISFGQGVADRTAGWNGQTFVISTRAVEGERKEERYSLDKAHRLVVITEQSGPFAPKIKLKRTYERVNS